MRLLSCAFFYLASLVSAEDFPKFDSSEVNVLNKDNFASFLKTKNVSLIEFFAPWCGHCQRLEPHFKTAAGELLASDIALAHVNCVDNQELCTEHGVRGYPTLKVFKNGVATEYEGPRESEGIVKYMKKQVLPAVSTLTNLKDIETFKNQDDVVIIGVFPEGESATKTSFEKIANELRNEHSFGEIPHGIHVLKKFDEGHAFLPLKDFGSEESFKKWLSAESIPLMAEVLPENYNKYIASGLPMAYLFYQGEDMRKEYGPVVEEIVKSYKGKINTVYINAERFAAHAKALQLPGEKWPAFVIHEMENDLKYPFLQEKLEKEQLSKFVSSFASGKLEPSYKSEEIPEKDEGPVKTIVFKNFESVAFDKKKDVLVELYAPWCGACRRIAPVYDALAKAYAPHSDKLVLAKMDATANDLPRDAGHKLTKFPTFLLYKAGSDNKPVELEQPNDDLKTFTDFLSEHATNKVTIDVEAVKKQYEAEKEAAEKKAKEEAELKAKEEADKKAKEEAEKAEDEDKQEL